MGAHSGPFEVISNAGERPVRDNLQFLEQFRHALGSVLGKPDLKLVWPVRLVVLRGGHGSTIALGRDARMASVSENEPLTGAFAMQLTRLLLDENTRRMPDGIEQGLIALFSTLAVSGTHITIGAEPPAALRTRDWARLHMLITDANTLGEVKVMMSNLEQGADLDVALRNAFQKNGKQIEQQLDAYLSAGKFGTGTISGRPLSPTRDLRVRQMDAGDGRLARADLELAAGDAGAEAEYRAIHGAEADDGLGLALLRAGKKPEAAEVLAGAVKQGSHNARTYVEVARAESDKTKKRALLDRAAELNPLWAEPSFEMVQGEAGPVGRAGRLKKAAELDPRNARYWQMLALADMEGNQFVDAGKAWANAEKAAANPEERERIRQARVGVEGARADFESEERKRRLEEEARELDRLKNASLAEIHAAEAKANKALNPESAGSVNNPVRWEDLDVTAAMEGQLERVDCRGRGAQLTVAGADGKKVRLAIADLSQVGVLGGDGKVRCGVQTPGPRVGIQYAPKPNAKTGVLGQVVVIEYK